MELDILKKVIVDVLDVDESEITLETSFVDDLGADSLDIYQIIMGMEEELDIEVSEDDLGEDIKTVGDAIELIKKTLN